ncbi:uncharacterized protein LOC125028566 isoform X2 [Penaeus chinensis]|uniref:uncharacterized protein LOC125028566 isoform X2 n=1 Tax=Penaeus chinensis TaxID=139456 RepID=UPI001FB777D4|nr:uncharacterized protein LOC125028566 isoform X2 [Penaeus chinensis]
MATPHQNIQSFLPLVSSFLFHSEQHLWTVEACGDHVATWLESVMRENDRFLAEVSPARSPACLQSHARLLFHHAAAARDCALSEDVKYRALEMYCSFAPAHLDAQIAQARASTPPGGEQEERIRRLRARVEQQAPLRALTCLMVACKVHLDHESLNPRTLQRLLESEGFLYTIADIVRSEQRVLEQLEFRCFRTTTALELLQLLMSAVVLDCLCGGAKDSAFQCQFVNSLETLHRTAVSLLDCALLNRKNIYEDFYHLLKGRREIHASHRATFERISQDRVLFVGSTLVSATWAVASRRGAARAAACLMARTGIPPGDFLGLSSCIWAVRREKKGLRKRRKLLEAEQSWWELVRSGQVCFGSSSTEESDN